MPKLHGRIWLCFIVKPTNVPVGISAYEFQMLIARVFLIVLLFFVATSRTNAQAPSDEDWDWVNRNYPAALNHFLPIKRDLSFDLAFRSHRDLYTDVLEFSFAFQTIRTPSKLVANIRMADTVSIYDQLMTFHRQQPSETFENLKSKVKIKQFSFGTKECPALLARINDLSKMRLKLPFVSDIIVLHPMIYEFWFSTNITEMHLSLVNDADPLAHWANDTRREIEACIERQQRNQINPKENK